MKNPNRLKPLSMHGHNPDDVLAAFLQVKPGEEEGRASGVAEEKTEYSADRRCSVGKEKGIEDSNRMNGTARKR